MFPPEKCVENDSKWVYVFGFMLGGGKWIWKSFIFVTKYIGNINSLTDLKTLGRSYNFLFIFGTEAVVWTKYVCEIFEGNKCDNLQSQKLLCI